MIDGGTGKTGFEFFTDFSKSVYDICLANYWENSSSRIGIVLASSYGSINARRTLLKQAMSTGRVFLDNVLIPDNVPSSAVGRVAKKLGIQGPCLSISCGNEGAMSALYMGAYLIRTGRIDEAICCHVDHCGGQIPFPFVAVGARIQKTTTGMLLSHACKDIANVEICIDKSTVKLETECTLVYKKASGCGNTLGNEKIELQANKEVYTEQFSNLMNRIHDLMKESVNVELLVRMSMPTAIKIIFI